MAKACRTTRNGIRNPLGLRNKYCVDGMHATGSENRGGSLRAAGPIQRRRLWPLTALACRALAAAGALAAVVSPAAGASGTVQFTASGWAVGESAGSLHVTVSRANGSSGAASVAYATANGTATAGSDYTATSGTLSWTDGDAADKSFDVPILSDDTAEGDETFTVLLQNAVGASIGAPATNTASITDDDPTPSVSLSLSSTNLAEAAGASTVRATLSNPSSKAVTVRLFPSGGTATLTSDYTLTSTNISIAAGATSGSVTLRAVQDALDEADETVVIRILSVTNAVIGAASQVEALILDDDAPPVASVALVAPAWMSEAGGSVTCRVSIAPVSALPVTVTLAYGGTATAGQDYTYTADTVTVPAGSLSASVAFEAIEDSVREAAETVTVQIAAATNATFSATNQAVATLFDDGDGQHWIGPGPRVLAWTNATPADRIRLGVRDRGVYRVEAGEIARAGGLATNAVLEALAAGAATLSSGGRNVAWTAYGGALYFYGEPTAEMYAPENVYWLQVGAAGPTMETLVATPESGAATNSWFWHTEAYRSSFVSLIAGRDKRSGISSLTNVPNFGLWVPGVAAESSRTKTKTVRLADFCDGAPTGVWARVSLASYGAVSPSDTAHTGEIQLNGVSCGSASWIGEQSLLVDGFAARGVVTNGTVQFTVKNDLIGTGPNDFMLTDAWLTYPRSYRAVDDLLVCAGGDAGTACVAGLTTNAVAVWDVTDPASPCVLDAPVWQAADGTWSTAFLCGGAAARYAVFGAPSGAFAPSVSGVRDIDWSSATEMPEYAIVTPPRRWFPGFEEAVRPLADFRSAQGLSTRVVDAEEIYNAFTHGLAHPGAFQRFSAAGVTQAPAPRLRYLLFAGNGGSDYKLDAIGFGERWPWVTYFPLYLYPVIGETDALMAPNDMILGNGSGSSVPEVAVGRFIATNAAELASMVAKTIRYELTAPWKSRGTFVASTQLAEDTINFSNLVSQAVTSFAAGGWTPKAFYPYGILTLSKLWQNTSVTPQTGASIELQSGSGILYYFGHSSDQMLGTASSGTGCFVNQATLRTASWPFAPVLFVAGCRAGRWTLYDFTGTYQNLAEAGVRNPQSGFAATISAAGYMSESEAVGFANGFRNAVSDGALRLGDAWCAAFGAVGASVAQSLQHLSLLGDPALVINPNHTARGTPTAWLIEQGLTNNAYADLSDVDGDGFALWQEYQAGTDFSVSNGFAIRQFTVSNTLANASAICFQPQGGVQYRVYSTTNLLSGPWESYPWKASGGASWSSSPIPGDWPIKTIWVPAPAGCPARYYKVVPSHE